MYDARAIGFDKMAQASKQDADNARRDAGTLHEAADALDGAPTRPLRAGSGRPTLPTGQDETLAQPLGRSHDS